MTDKYMCADLKTPITKTIVRFKRIIEEDTTHGRPDEDDEGFWPSLDPKAPGYVGKNPKVPFDAQMAQAKNRMREFEDGEWSYIAVRARAFVQIPIGGTSVVNYTITSPGLWGIESDSSAYLDEVFEEEKAQLIEHLKLFSDFEVKEAI